ncbi:MAG: deoxyribose-phosphate aldolase [Bacillota bacterium]|nr:deoxyribose-phosphate aldolase [Bacillota bacterium]
MELNKYIDHTFLKADGKKADIDKLIAEGKEYDFMSLCINPAWIEYVSDQLKGTDVKVCTVVGFPLGAMTTEGKVFEASDAISKGADEIDMVINIGKLKDRDLDYVVKEIKALKETCKDKVLKVIIETALLDEEEIRLAAQAVLDGGGDFVKTSTGFSTRGASLEDVKIIKEVVGDKCKIKASGGIRSHEDMMAMIQAGADRIGASAGAVLLG